MSGTDKSTEFGSALIEGLKEVVAWRRGEIELKFGHQQGSRDLRERAARSNVAGARRILDEAPDVASDAGDELPSEFNRRPK